MACIVEQILGMPRSQFVSAHLGRLPRECRCGPEAVASLPGVPEVAALLPLYNDRAAMLSVVRDGSAHAAPLLANGNLDLEGLWSLFYGGSSLILNSLFKIDAGVKAFCEDLSLSLGHRVQANGYLTPARSRAFDTHYDAHDVIVVQLHGTKAWEIFDTDRIVPRHPRRASKTLDPRDLEAGIRQETTLVPGSVLYLPRGYAHKAHTTDQASFHITFSLDPVTIGEMLRTALDLLEDQRAELREHVSADCFRDASVTIGLAQIVEQIADSLGDPRLARKSLETIRMRALQDAMLTPRGVLQNGLETASSIRLRPDVFYEILDAPEGDVVVTNGIKGTRLSPTEAAVFERITSGDSVRIGALTASYGTEPLRVLLRLTAMGLLEISEHGHGQ